MKEIEAKFKLNDPNKVLKQKGLSVVSKNHVIDIYFDNPSVNLKKDDRVLRLRKENDKCLIAYKGPRDKKSKIIEREEIEEEVSDFEQTYKIITSLGFIPIAKAEKGRTTISYDDVKITLDKYPFIGYFVEIEGEYDKVISVSKMLGFDLKDSIKKNCTESFLEYCKEKRLKLDNPALCFTFDDEKKYSN